MKLKRYTMFDMLIIAMMAAIGIAIKPIVVPLTHIITGPLLIPGGAVAGGFYMLWIVLAMGVVRRKGACILTALVQAIIVLAIGATGNHGIMTLVTYTIPGIACEIIFLVSLKKKFNILHFLFAGIAANCAGTFLSNMVFFRLPFLPLVLSLSCACLSGAIGGIIAYSISNKIEKLGLLT
jgi:ABC-type thiamin/hydroxymethylpyrimidine transport system permease subunit